MAKSSNSRKAPPKTDDRTPGSFGFFARLFNFFSSSADPERDKKRLLKEIEKLLKKQRHKFYRAKTGEVLPALARYFYDIYRAVASAHLLVEHAEASNVLRTIVIEHFMSETQKEIAGKFDEEIIKERSRVIPSKDLAAEYKEYAGTFFSSFDAEKVAKINETYNLLDVFLQIIHFDYYFLIKKFDSQIGEVDFKYKPRFEPINGEYVSDDLKDFMEIIPLVDEKQEWQSVLEILQIYKGTEVIPPAQWRTVVRSITDLRRSGIFKLMVCHIDRNPYYKQKSTPPKHKIVEEYVSRLKTQVEMIVQKVINERRKSQIDDLSQKVFGTTAVSRMRNYTEKENLAFSKKMLGGYKYVAPMNYLNAFLVDYLRGEILIHDSLNAGRARISAKRSRSFSLFSSKIFSPGARAPCIRWNSMTSTPQPRASSTNGSISSRLRRITTKLGPSLWMTPCRRFSDNNSMTCKRRAHAPPRRMDS